MMAALVGRFPAMAVKLNGGELAKNEPFQRFATPCDSIMPREMIGSAEFDKSVRRSKDLKPKEVNQLVKRRLFLPWKTIFSRLAKH
jgi:hypothetical protein